MVNCSNSDCQNQYIPRGENIRLSKCRGYYWRNIRIPAAKIHLNNIQRETIIATATPTVIGKGPVSLSTAGKKARATWTKTRNIAAASNLECVRRSSKADAGAMIARNKSFIACLKERKRDKMSQSLRALTVEIETSKQR